MCRKYDAGRRVLRFAGDVVSLVRVAGATEVAQFMLRHQCVLCKVASPFAQYKLAVVLPYLARCGTAEDTLLLGSYYSESCWWVVLGLVMKLVDVRCGSCMVLAVYDGMYQLVRIFKGASRV